MERRTGVVKQQVGKGGKKAPKNEKSKTGIQKKGQKNSEAELVKMCFEAANMLDLQKVRHCITNGVCVNVYSPAIRETLLHVALNAMQKRHKQRQCTKTHQKYQNQGEEGAIESNSSKPEELLDIQNEEEFVEYLMKAGININAKDCYGNTCVHVASSPPLMHILKLMYRIGKPNINIRNIANRRPLDEAVANGYLDAVQLFLLHLKSPASFQRRISRRSSIFNLDSSISMNRGPRRRFSVLPEDVVSENELKIVLTNVDEEGNSVLYHAIIGGSPEVVSLLVSKGADILSGGNGQRKTLLQLAVIRGNLEIVKILLGDDTNSISNELLHMQDSDGNTALHTAVFKGRVEILEFLVSRGADLKIKNAAKRTALDEAVLKEPINHLIIDILDVNKKHNKMLKKEQTGNIFAKLKDIDIGGKFGKKDKDKNKDEDKSVAETIELDTNSLKFLDAAHTGNRDSIYECLKLGVNPDVKDSSGETALHIVVEAGHPDVETLLTMILDAGAMVNVTNCRSETTLHYAASRGLTSAMMVLLEHRADPDVRDIKGETALFRVVAEKLSIEDSMTCTQLLINAGADLNLADENGMTPLHVATKYGKEDLMQLLVDSGADASLDECDFVIYF